MSETVKFVVFLGMLKWLSELFFYMRDILGCQYIIIKGVWVPKMRLLPSYNLFEISNFATFFCILVTPNCCQECDFLQLLTTPKVGLTNTLSYWSCCCCSSVSTLPSVFRVLLCFSLIVVRGIQKVHRLTQLITRYVHHIWSLSTWYPASEMHFVQHFSKARIPS